MFDDLVVWSPLPMTEFKVLDPDSPDDYGRRCVAVQLSAGGFELRVKSGSNWLTVGQAPFPTLAKCKEWAQMRWEIDGQLEPV